MANPDFIHRAARAPDVNVIGNKAPLLIVTASLFACGGAADTLLAASMAGSPATSLPASPLARCLAYAPGTQFTMSDGTRWHIIAAPFQGQAAIGAAQMGDDERLVGAQFYTIDASDFQLLGDVVFASPDSHASATVYFPGYRIPVTLAQGASVQLRGMSTTYTFGLPGVAPEIRHVQQASAITFIGQENLQLGGQAFPAACKLKSEGDSVDDGLHWAQQVWIAQGYGVIQREDIDGEGKAIPGSRHELTQVISPRAPQ